jgi:Ni/Fe-hydrogenase subunit HybB-like protein
VASGVALAAGGFTTACPGPYLGRHYYEPVVRPALLTAMLGYTFVVLGLLVDIGRSWAIWKPMIHWNPNSVLFEVAMCVMFYLNVLYIEFLPIVVPSSSRAGSTCPGRWPVLNGPSTACSVWPMHPGQVMWVFIIAGVVLSCMHQSSLGSLMLVAPTKLHPLWYTPMLPLLFLTSAIAVGYPMVVFETTLATSSFETGFRDENPHPPDPDHRLFCWGFTWLLKVGDMVVPRHLCLSAGRHGPDQRLPGGTGLGVIVPWLMLLLAESAPVAAGAVHRLRA